MKPLTQQALLLALSGAPGRRIVMHPATKAALMAEWDGELVPNENPDAADQIGGRLIETDPDMHEGSFVLT